jgi:hypothetical protein
MLLKATVTYANDDFVSQKLVCQIGILTIFYKFAQAIEVFFGCFTRLLLGCVEHYPFIYDIYFREQMFFECIEYLLSRRLIFSVESKTFICRFAFYHVFLWVLVRWRLSSWFMRDEKLTSFFLSSEKLSGFGAGTDRLSPPWWFCWSLNSSHKSARFFTNCANRASFESGITEVHFVNVYKRLQITW